MICSFRTPHQTVVGDGVCYFKTGQRQTPSVVTRYTSVYAVNPRKLLDKKGYETQFTWAIVYVFICHLPTKLRI